MERGERDDKEHSGRSIYSTTTTERDREDDKRRIHLATKWPYIGDWFLVEERIVHFCYDGILHNIRRERDCLYCGMVIPEGIKVALDILKVHDGDI